MAYSLVNFSDWIAFHFFPLFVSVHIHTKLCYCKHRVFCTLFFFSQIFPVFSPIHLFNFKIFFISFFMPHSRCVLLLLHPSFSFSLCFRQVLLPKTVKNMSLISKSRENKKKKKKKKKNYSIMIRTLEKCVCSWFLMWSRKRKREF